MKILYALAALIVVAGIVLLFVPDQRTPGSVLLVIGVVPSVINSSILRRRRGALRT